MSSIKYDGHLATERHFGRLIVVEVSLNTGFGTNMIILSVL